MNLTCIVCPKGCDLEVTMKDGKVEKVEGNVCKRGFDYAVNEITSPVRVITTTVSTPFGRLPVRSDKPLPKEDFRMYMDKIREVKIIGSVKIGDVVVEDIDGNGVNIVATGNVFEG